MKIVLPPVIEIDDHDATLHLVAALNNALGLEFASIDCQKKEMVFRPGTKGVVYLFPPNKQGATS